jgi:hypothetical protein
MKVGSIWIQLFSASGELDPSGQGATPELVAALKTANIACVGWGYCYSKNAASDGDLAKQLCAKYGIKAFIADVEPGNTVHHEPDSWLPADFNRLIGGLNAAFGKDNLGISTFGNLRGHDDAAKIYKLAVGSVALFAPQIYWYNKPAVTYAQDCIKSFRDASIGNPLVATTQAYWGSRQEWRRAARDHGDAGRRVRRRLRRLGQADRPQLVPCRQRQHGRFRVHVGRYDRPYRCGPP